jgi:hypothetical protein
MPSFCLHIFLNQKSTENNGRKIRRLNLYLNMINTTPQKTDETLPQNDYFFRCTKNKIIQIISIRVAILIKFMNGL